MFENAIVTYIYPAAIKYLNDCIHSISKQTCQDFKLIIFNDGATIEKINLPIDKYEIIDISGRSPLEVRIRSFEHLKLSQCQKIIFQDIDDTMSDNRVEILLDLLDRKPIVCNDLNHMDTKGKILSKNIWGTRLPDNFTFSADFIKNKNIIGFGNTGISGDLLKQQFKFNSRIVAADWYIFYQLLKIPGIEAIFTSKCQTNYRQHDANDAGFSVFDKRRLSHIINVKKAQFNSLFEMGFQEMDSEIKTIKEITSTKDQTTFLEKQMPIYPFWWEETNYIKPSK